MQYDLFSSFIRHIGEFFGFCFDVEIKNILDKVMTREYCWYIKEKEKQIKNKVAQVKQLSFNNPSFIDGDMM